MASHSHYLDLVKRAICPEHTNRKGQSMPATTSKRCRLPRDLQPCRLSKHRPHREAVL